MRQGGKASGYFELIGHSKAEACEKPESSEKSTKRVLGFVVRMLHTHKEDWSASIKA